MAAALQSFRFAVRSCKCRSIPRRQITRPIGRGREFSTTHLRWKDPVFLDEDDEEGELEERLLNLAFEDGEEAFENAKKSLLEAQELSEDIESDLKETIEEGHIEAWEKREPRNKKLKQTFMNMGEDEPWEEEGMLPDDDDDMTALGHLELEQHREMREYARLAAWDMPLLSQMVKPFQPPTVDMCLRFRYTTYMGEQHPAEKKVVLEFSPADMPNLTDLQRDKLRKLVGVRYNPEEDLIKMSCESFETQAQNKRYLGDLVDKLLVEARDPTDTFEDVPLDTRHHTFKPRYSFPEEWKVTEHRRIELMKYREGLAIKDQQRELVDGVKQIEQELAKHQPVGQSLHEVAATIRGLPKGKRVSVRR